MRFRDSSALVPLIVTQATSAAADAFVPAPYRPGWYDSLAPGCSPCPHLIAVLAPPSFGVTRVPSLAADRLEPPHKLARRLGAALRLLLEAIEHEPLQRFGEWTPGARRQRLRELMQVSSGNRQIEGNQGSEALCQQL